MILCFIGPSGCGKDTQVGLLANDQQVENISTGELLRDLYSKGDDDGVEAAKFWQKGEWVPDDIIMKIVQKRLNATNKTNIIILNGFPRTVSQAIKYDELIGLRFEINKVVYFDLDNDSAIERLSNRRICPKCENIYHLIYKPSKLGEKCENCKINLVQRKDDTKEIIKKRLDSFNKTTKPIIDYYTSQSKLIKIDASPNIDVIYKALTMKLDINV